MFNRFKHINMFTLLLLHKLFIRQYRLINLMLYAFLSIISYIFLYDLNSIKVIKIFIFTLIYFAFSMYVTDNYTLYKNMFIKFIQQLVFSFLTLFLGAFILDILDIYIINKIASYMTDAVVEADLDNN